jgi:hypothetical protein
MLVYSIIEVSNLQECHLAGGGRGGTWTHSR